MRSTLSVLTEQMDVVELELWAYPSLLTYLLDLCQRRGVFLVDTFVGRASTFDLCRQTGVRAIFTTSPPPCICAAALSNIQERNKSDKSAVALREKTMFLKDRLRYNEIPYLGAEESHIVPVLIGREDKCSCVSEALRQQGYYATPVRFPTVPRGSARLRIAVNPYHSNPCIEGFCAALARILRNDVV